MKQIREMMWVVGVLFLLVGCGGSTGSSEPILEATADGVATIEITAVPPIGGGTPLLVPTVVIEPPERPLVRPPTVPMIVFVTEGQLFGLLVDVAGGGVMTGDPFLLTEEAGVVDAKISPDGRHVAYRSGAWMGGENRLSIISWDGRIKQISIDMREFPFVPEMTELAFGDLNDPNQSVMGTTYLWANNNQLLFGTGIYDSMGYSPGSHSDLWSVSLEDLQVRSLLAAGEGAPVFAISEQNGRLLFARQDAVLSSDSPEEEPNLLFDVQPVEMMESFYYPSVQWVDHGEIAYITVSAPIDYSVDGPPSSQSANILFVRNEGPPGEVNPIFNNDIYNPPIWSDDGLMMGYVQKLQDGYHLVLSDGMLQESFSWMVQTDYMAFHSWAPDSNHFMYSDGAGYYVDGFDEFYLSRFVSGEERVIDGKWIDETHLVVGVQNYEGDSFMELVSLPGGENEPILSIPAGFYEFELWVP